MEFNTFFDLIKAETLALHAAEIIATVAAIIYVILAARGNIWCWFFQIISCFFWAWVSYYLYNLQIDSLLQVFYIVISAWGLHQWKYGNSEKKELAITRLSFSKHIMTIVAGGLLSVSIGWFYTNYTTSELPYLDAFTTVFSILTTFMVIHKKLENWLYWIVIDIAYTYLYWMQGAYLFSILLVVYTIIAFLGWLEWQKKYKKGYQTEV